MVNKLFNILLIIFFLMMTPVLLFMDYVVWNFFIRGDRKIVTMKEVISDYKKVLKIYWNN